MIWMALVAFSNLGVSIYLLRENRKLTHAVIAGQAGDVPVPDRPSRKKSRLAESRDEKPYTQWRIPSEGVGP